MIPFFLRHYEPIVDRIIVFDDGSDDRSLELLGASPKVELRRLEKYESQALGHIAEMNRCWKESRGRADWVLICDIDEHLYHADLRGYLARCQELGFTILDPTGYEMVSRKFPASGDSLPATVPRGVYSQLLEKKAIFNPDAIDEINYGTGRHAANPIGRLVFPAEREVKLLHYRHLGLDYVLQRRAEMRTRQTRVDEERGWSKHYQRSDDEVRRDFEKLVREADEVIPPPTIEYEKIPVPVKIEKRFWQNIFKARPREMRIDLYTTCWNEERMIPFFLRHYEPIVDRIIVFDDKSSDRSRELLTASSKVEVRDWNRGDSYILAQMQELNQCWKESRERADWIFICDIDEHLYHHKNLRDYLLRCREAGATILNPVGVDMVSENFPETDTLLCQTLRNGARSFLLDKLAVFNPDAIEEIHYRAGRHAARPEGWVVFPAKREVKLLHYKYLGFDYLKSRTEALQTRQTDFDRARGWGAHDARSEDELRGYFAALITRAGDFSLIGKKPEGPARGRLTQIVKFHQRDAG